MNAKAERQAIILYTRIPVAGKTKTRLMPFLSGAACAELHTILLSEMLRAIDDYRRGASDSRGIPSDLAELPADLFVAWTGGALSDHPAFCAKFPADTLFFPQEGASLGEGMFRAMLHVRALGYDRCLLMGSDIPGVQGSDIGEAFGWLRGSSGAEDRMRPFDFVFGPAEDGGYWLAGANLHVPESALRAIFSLEAYSHPEVLAETAARVPDGFTYALLPEAKPDVDTIRDLRLLREGMQNRKEGPLSGDLSRFLSANPVLSVIIPVYQEERNIRKLIGELEKLRDRCEVIFVDGGSSDRTVPLLAEAIAQKNARYGGKEVYRLLHAPKGRGKQLRAGTEAANGDVLFYLHADVELPENPVEELLEVMKNHEIGCFGVRWRSRNFFMWTNRVISNRRARKGIIFGDQGMFLTRELYERAGGFPDLPLMEDYQFSLSLRALGKEQRAPYAVGLTRHRLIASDRRYPAGTIPKLRVMYRMWRLRRRYLAGEDAAVLAEEYR